MYINSQGLSFISCVAFFLFKGRRLVRIWMDESFVKLRKIANIGLQRCWESPWIQWNSTRTRRVCQSPSDMSTDKIGVQNKNPIFGKTLYLHGPSQKALCSKISALLGIRSSTCWVMWTRSSLKSNTFANSKPENLNCPRKHKSYFGTKAHFSKDPEARSNLQKGAYLRISSDVAYPCIEVYEVLYSHWLQSISGVIE